MLATLAFVLAGILIHLSASFSNPAWDRCVEHRHVRVVEVACTEASTGERRSPRDAGPGQSRASPHLDTGRDSPSSHLEIVKSDHSRGRHRVVELHMIGTPFNTRFITWMAVALGGVCMVVMRDVSLLLGSIQKDAYATYPASVLFKPRLHPGEGAAEITGAWAVWDGFAGRDLLVATHLGVDVVYMAVYGFLLWRVLKSLDFSTRRVRWLVGIVVGADVLEGGATACALLIGNATTGVGTLPWISNLKWLAVTVALVTVLLGWLSGRAGDRSAGPIAANVVEHAREATTTPAPAGTARPWSRLKGQLAVAGGFTLLVALPAGGPLDQIPDVLRNSLEDPWPTLPLSGIAVLLLAACGSSRDTGQRCSTTRRRQVTRSLFVAPDARVGNSRGSWLPERCWCSWEVSSSVTQCRSLPSLGRSSWQRCCSWPSCSPAPWLYPHLSSTRPWTCLTRTPQADCGGGWPP